MSLTYQTICDGCGKVVEGWPENGQSHPGWANATQGLCRWDYCAECWAALRRPFVEREANKLQREAGK